MLANASLNNKKKETIEINRLTSEPSCKDEMRVGQKNGLVYQWAKKGTRPRQPKDRLCFRAPTPVPCSFTSTTSVAVSRAVPTP